MSSQESIKVVKAPRVKKEVSEKAEPKKDEKKVVRKPKTIVMEVKEEAPVVQEVVCASVSEVSEASEQAPISVQQRLNEQIGSVSSMIKTLKGIEGSLKEATKSIKKEGKTKKRVLSEEEKEKRRTTSGFNKPVAISDELASFMGLQQGSQASRVEVTRAINDYIKKNNLQNGRQFKVDEKLKSLLGEAQYPINSKQPELGNGFTYFNLPSYMKKHFLKVQA